MTPDYLYHYTSVETLSCILQNHTIRFNSLDKMDDLQEKEAGDIKEIGQFIYVSCWTDEDQESIPMWKMYASYDAGIRIRVKSNPFVVYRNTIKGIEQNGTTSDTSVDNTILSFIPLNDIFQKGFLCPQALSGPILHKVEYTQDKEKLYPSLLTYNKKQFILDMEKMGKYKNVYWQFQKEWRYILHFIPLNINQTPSRTALEFNIIANQMRLGAGRQPFPYYDMRLDNLAFSTMEITPSPKLSPDNWKRLLHIISEYNPSATIKESALKNLI